MRFFCNVIIGKNRSHNDQFWSKCAPIWFIFFSPKPHPLNFNTFWPFTCECACFPHTTTFARWCLSCSGRFRMVTSSRESWAGEGRVSASSPPLPLHTSFSPWPNSPPAWRGKTHRAGWLILSRRYQSYGLAWSPRVSLEGIQFHHMCFKIRPLWFVGAKYEKCHGKKYENKNSWSKFAMFPFGANHRWKKFYQRLHSGTSYRCESFKSGCLMETYQPQTCSG